MPKLPPVVDEILSSNFPSFISTLAHSMSSHHSFRIVDAYYDPTHDVPLFPFSPKSLAIQSASEKTPKQTSYLISRDSRLSLAASLSNMSSPASNGAPAAPTRASPAPQQAPPAIPNGKNASPPVERSNPMPGRQASYDSQGPAQTVASTNPKIAAQQASDMKNIVRRKLTGYVGFANLPNQWHRKSVRKGFNFNVMVVGKSLNSDSLVYLLPRPYPHHVSNIEYRA